MSFLNKNVTCFALFSYRFSGSKLKGEVRTTFNAQLNALSYTNRALYHASSISRLRGHAVCSQFKMTSIPPNVMPDLRHYLQQTCNMAVHRVKQTHLLDKITRSSGKPFGDNSSRTLPCQSHLLLTMKQFGYSFALLQLHVALEDSASAITPRQADIPQQCPSLWPV